MNIAAIIVGIDGYEKYTEPLIRSVRRHEPECAIVVVDNASEEPYPQLYYDVGVWRTERLCYSAAINEGHSVCGDADWIVVLSNDVLCTGPFAHILAEFDQTELVGPLLKAIQIEQVGLVQYLEGWCIAFPRLVWDALGGWDEGYKISSYEDVDVSHRARKAGFPLVEARDLPFVHLDQKQRFGLVPNYWASEVHNRAYFCRKHGLA